MNVPFTPSVAAAGLAAVILFANPAPSSASDFVLAWNKLVDQPWKIIFIGMRDCAHRF